MKIINLNDSVVSALTCDNTSITCDDTTITCDQTFFSGGTHYILTIIPRFFEATVSLILYNELTKVQTIQTCYTSFANGYQHIPYMGVFVEGDSLEITVNSLSGQLIFRDKGYVTIEDDLENYKLNIPSSGGVYKL